MKVYQANDKYEE
jgi:hypothetical protein